jgi:hypothetical protein
MRGSLPAPTGSLRRPKLASSEAQHTRQVSWYHSFMRNLSVTQPRFVTLIATALLLAVQLSPASAAEPGPIGPDIRVGPGLSAACPNIAMSPDGDFAVVWNNNYSESHPIPQGVFARHFDREGRPTQRAPIQLDVPGSIESSGSRVVALPGAGYFVAWFEYRNSVPALVGRFLDPAGRPRSSGLRLGRSATPAGLTVVGDSLIVAWRVGLDGPLRARRFDFDGHPLGNVMRLSDRRNIGVVDLAPLADSFVAAWERFNGNAWVVEAQRFSLTGEPLGATLRANRRSLGAQFGVQAASDGSDRFALAWTMLEMRSDPKTGLQVADEETRARFFDADGPSSPEVHPNQLFTGSQKTSGLAMNGEGLALVTWYSDRNASSTSLDVVGRFLLPDGQPASKAFPISRNLAGIDFCARAANGGGDEWAVAWLSQHEGIFARRLTSADDPGSGN